MPWRDRRSSDIPLHRHVAVGIDTSINGNVNSGAIGRLQGLATHSANPYGKVYGTGIQLRFGLTSWTTLTKHARSLVPVSGCGSVRWAILESRA
jgi:hypothetical protein